MKIESKCLHAGYEPKNGEPRVLPIYQSTTYKYDSTDFVGQLFDLTAEGHMYSRISNPTVDAVEKKIAALEGGVGALCTTSGQSATFLALMNVLESGDHLVASSTIQSIVYHLPKIRHRSVLCGSGGGCRGNRKADSPEYESGIWRDYGKPCHECTGY